MTSSRFIVAILGMLAAFAPLATDMYLPAFGVMTDYFKADDGAIEASLSVFFLGMAVGQLAYGPLIDRYGRRGPLLAGIALYAASTLACLLTTDVAVFTGLRFFQAAGGCAGMIIGRTIVSDLFDEKDSARALSLLMVVMTLAPIVAPILGGVIVAYAGWQAIFVAMLAFGLVCGALVWFLVPETLPPAARRRQTAGQILATWRTLLTNRRFMVPVAVGGLAQACMFAFITGSPFVFITLHGASAQTYGWLFGLIAAALIVAAQINRIALGHRTAEVILGWSLALVAVAGIATVAAVPTGSLVVLLAALWFAIGALGFIGANATAIAMTAAGRDAGTGSSFIGALQFGFAFLISSLVAATQNGTAYPMALAIGGCAVAAALLWFAAGTGTRRAAALRA